MDKLDKIIKGIEMHASGRCQVLTANGKEYCPYWENDDNCMVALLKDALELLKAQEVPGTNVGEWTTKRTQEYDGEWYCSECGYEPIVMSDDMKYCPGCGRKMTMPEPPKEG